MDETVLFENTVASAKLTVTTADLASALSLENTDIFPDVLATARLIALMEIASARVLQAHLATGQLSVGVSIDVTHTAPTPVGAEVTATALYVGRDGKFYLFEVIATDAGGEIGRGLHKRAIIEVARLQKTAQQRINNR